MILTAPPPSIASGNWAYTSFPLVSSQAALAAAAALRSLRQKEHVSSAALQQIFTEHNIRIQTRGFCARDLAPKVLKTLEISFTSVALLPREPPFTPSSADDLAEFLNSLSLAQPRA